MYLQSIYAKALQTQNLQPAPSKRTLFYKTVAEHYEASLDLASEGQFDGRCDRHSSKPQVRKAFKKYLDCGIFAHGLARAR